MALAIICFLACDGHIACALNCTPIEQKLSIQGASYHIFSQLRIQHTKKKPLYETLELGIASAF